MKPRLSVAVIVALLCILAVPCFAEMKPEKEHDFIPRFHNLIFIVDVSDSMMQGYPNGFDHSKLFVATRGFAMFNAVMPHVPHWQYDLNTGFITYGDCDRPRILGIVGPWNRKKYEPLYGWFRKEGFGPCRTAAMPEGLQLAGSLMTSLAGRTAIVIFSDGGTEGECPQKTAAALKDTFGDKVVVYGIFIGGMEVGYRNLYEVCKLTGGYVRSWEEVRSKAQMKEFAWDILGREIMFPYPEIFFKEKSADLLPSEALKLESVANFMLAIPQYTLQIDGHTTFIGGSQENYKLGMERAKNVKDALVNIFHIHPARIAIRSWGEELPRYDNQNPDIRQKNRQANLYLMLPLRNFPYDEKHLHTFGTPAVGDIFNTQERDADTEWAWPNVPPPGAPVPIVGAGKQSRRK